MSEKITLSPEQKLGRIEEIVQAHPEVAGLQAYEYLRSNVKEQQVAFINGERDALSLDYKDLNPANIERLKGSMLLALNSLMSGEQNPKTRALYRAIEYRYSELFMLDMARIVNDDSYSEQERAQAREMFVSANEALYGQPDRGIFSAIARKSLAPLLSGGDSDGTEAQKIRGELGALIGSIDQTDYELFVPSDEVMERVGALTRSRFDQLVDHIDTEKTYDVAAMAEALDAALTKLGGKDLGWRVAIVPKSNVLAVSAHQKLVEVGENRKPAKGDELRGKALHEVGVHAGRSINALKAGWLSAAYGQDGYLDFEESFATALEDAFKGKFGDHGQNYYLIAGLAYGYDNHPPRDFKEVYEIMWRISALKKAASGQIEQSVLSKVKTAAFDNCMRLFRGTATTDKGVIYLKDLAYFKGQELVWRVLQNVHTQEDFDYLFAGKLDNTQEDHRLIAEAIILNRKV